MLHLDLWLMRVFHDLKQKELPEKLGISASHLSEIESGLKTPTLALLNCYAKVFEVSGAEILFCSENLEACLKGKHINADVPEKTRALLRARILYKGKEEGRRLRAEE